LIASLKEYPFNETVDWSNRRVVRILDSAGKCFARRGYSDTSIKEIATKIGITKSMVHYYFTSKMHLLHEVLNYINKQHMERVTKMMEISGEGAGDRTRQALKSLWKTVRDSRRFTRLSVEFWSVASRNPKLRAQLRKTHNASRELIAAGIEDALGDRVDDLPFSVDSLAALILAVLHGLAVQDYAEPKTVDVDEAYRVFMASLISGMSALGIE